MNIIPEFNDEIFKKNRTDQGLTSSEITKHILTTAKEVKSKKGLFMVKEASVWIEEAKKRPIPNMLFSEFWHEGELCILFADTNTGKSILAVQIGNSITLGEPIPGFKLEAPKQKVLYLDFELSDKQFEVRYSENYNNHYLFTHNFLRAEIDPDAEVPEGKFEEFLYSSLEKSISETEIKILIVDNITYLKSDNEKAKDALPLMKLLKALKTKFNLSILALAHTPKRDATKPINRNDLSGSKMLINFCDASFAIGESQQETGARYLKQIKARNTEVKYDSKNVMLCQIAKPSNFLMFNFKTHADEHDILLNRDNSYEDKRPIARAMKEEGATIDEIMQKLDVSRGWVSNNTSDITNKKGRNRTSKKDSSDNNSLLDFL